jgi:DNA-binding NarL/FixJ family response regulator
VKTITPREWRILEMIGKGLSSREIAAELSVSFHTVQSHRRSLLKKFDSANSVELVKKATEWMNPKGGQQGQ